MAAKSRQARRPTLPAFIAPMLAKPGTPFDAPDYLFEIKWDGTRTLTFVDHQGYRLLNRRQVDMTERYPEFAFLAHLPEGTVLDGEMVVLRAGKPDFALLQSREHSRTPMKIKMLARSTPATYVVFDLLYDGYESLLPDPLEFRRQRLAKLVADARSPRLLLSDGVIGQGKAYFARACQHELEGVVAKRLTSPYLPGKRTDAWIKIKRGGSVLCAIIGFLPSGDNDLRSLIIASNIDGDLRCVGKVGSGIDNAMRHRLNALLRARLQQKPLVDCKIRGKWVKPGLYCKISYLERTSSGEFRGPVFQELLEE
jgi:DNA ligase D-like protein (predicted ligase)